VGTPIANQTRRGGSCTLPGDPGRAGTSPAPTSRGLGAQPQVDFHRQSRRRGGSCTLPGEGTGVATSSRFRRFHRVPTVSNILDAFGRSSTTSEVEVGTSDLLARTWGGRGQTPPLHCKERAPGTRPPTSIVALSPGTPHPVTLSLDAIQAKGLHLSIHRPTRFFVPIGSGLRTTGGGPVVASRIGTRPFFSAASR